MAVYRIHRMRDHVRQQFRWAPHTIGLTTVKPKEYELLYEVEGASPYALWLDLKDTDRALQVGDLLESLDGDLRIYKYVGFEQAQWHIPESVTAQPQTPATQANP